MTGLWQRLQARLRPAPIDTVQALGTFLAERAALIAQKCATDYCRGKTGLASFALFEEKAFLDPFDACRWETFAAVLSDLFVLTEGRLRQAVSSDQRARLCAALEELYAASLASQPAARHRPQGWHDACELFGARLRAAAQSEAQSTAEIAGYSGKRLFDTLPIHISMRELDEEIVHGAVRFRMIAVSQEIDTRFVPAALARALTV